MILDEARRPGQSISAVARRFGISPSFVFNWQRQMDDGGQRALEAGEAVVPESEAKMLRARVRELERLLGKKTMETEILKEAIELARAENGCRAAHPRAGKVECECGGTSSRALATVPLFTPSPAEPRGEAELSAKNAPVVERIRELVARRGSYGYRRVTALLNRQTAAPRVNHKRIYRVMHSRS